MDLRDSVFSNTDQIGKDVWRNNSLATYWFSMTDEEMRIAIAEECGWKIFKDDGAWAVHSPDGRKWYAFDRDQQLDHMGVAWPDYPNDLNAMVEALVALLKRRNLRAFCNAGQDGTWECIITENETPNAIPCDGDHYGAGETLVVAMREAYLRAVGKWKDE